MIIIYINNINKLYYVDLFLLILLEHIVQFLEKTEQDRLNSMLFFIRINGVCPGCFLLNFISSSFTYYVLPIEISTPRMSFSINSSGRDTVGNIALRKQKGNFIYSAVNSGHMTL